jgi:hypothetical protein
MIYMRNIAFITAKSEIYLRNAGLCLHEWCLDITLVLEVLDRVQNDQQQKRTIKRGEIGFSNFLFSHNVKLKALISRNSFIEKIQNCDIDTMHNMLTFSAYGGKRLEQEKVQLLSRADGSAMWRLQALHHIETSLMREPLNATYWVSVCKVLTST